MQRHVNSAPSESGSVKPASQIAPGEIRAGNSDRQRVVDLLQRHYVDGRLNADELAERIDQALAARTMADLSVPLADLPRIDSPTREEPDRRAQASDDDDDDEDTSFRAHFLSYLLVMSLLVAIWLITSPGGYFWPIWPMLGWGIGLAFHWLEANQWLSSNRHKK